MAIKLFVWNVTIIIIVRKNLNNLVSIFQQCLPLVLMFDMKEDVEIDQGKYHGKHNS